MKRIVQFLTSVLLLMAAASPAPSFNLTACFSAALSDAVELSRAHAIRVLRGADFAMSKIDRQMVEAFGKAWTHSGNGTLPQEGVVLILQMADGGYSAKEMGATNENRQFTFRWHPATIAIVHTHPNGSDPKPQDEDIAVANKHRVPIFTITSRGMYVYDPGTRKLAKVMDNLNWLDVSNWRRRLLGKL
jgi:hypothetical protein